MTTTTWSGRDGAPTGAAPADGDAEGVGPCAEPGASTCVAGMAGAAHAGVAPNAHDTSRAHHAAARRRIIRWPVPSCRCFGTADSPPYAFRGCGSSQCGEQRRERGLLALRVRAGRSQLAQHRVDLPVDPGPRGLVLRLEARLGVVPSDLEVVDAGGGARLVTGVQAVQGVL